MNVRLKNAGASHPSSSESPRSAIARIDARPGAAAAVKSLENRRPRVRSASTSSASSAGSLAIAPRLSRSQDDTSRSSCKRKFDSFKEDGVGEKFRDGIMDSALKFACAEGFLTAGDAGMVGEGEDGTGVYSTSRPRSSSLESGRSKISSNENSGRSLPTGDASESSKRRKLDPVLKHISYLEPVRSYRRGPRGRRPALFCTPNDHADAAARHLEDSLKLGPEAAE